LTDVSFLSECGKERLRGELGQAHSGSGPQVSDGNGERNMARRRLVTVGIAVLIGLAGCGGPVNNAQQEPNTVVIDRFSFKPQTLSVKVGTSVTWRNDEAEIHTVVARNRSFNSPKLDLYDTYRFTFNVPGRYEYVCSTHGFMTGVVVVEP